MLGSGGDYRVHGYVTAIIENQMGKILGNGTDTGLIQSGFLELPLVISTW